MNALTMTATAAIKTTDDATRIAELETALRKIAEGNLGDGPGQANYARIRHVALAALAGTPETVNASERFARWLECGPKLAKAAGVYVGIKVTDKAPRD